MIRRSGTGPAGRGADRVPSLPCSTIHPHCQPAIPDEGRSQKNMISATAHFESHAPSQRSWRDAMPLRTTEPLKQKYPEAEITATAATDRQASCHSRNIPEARREMISGFPNPALATGRRARNNPGRMKPQAAIRQRRSKGSGNTISSLRDQNRTQARCHAPSDHERKCANGKGCSGGEARALRLHPWLNKPEISAETGYAFCV